MPSVSQKQQRFFGMVESGQIPRPKGMTAQQVHEFAATRRKGLPVRKGTMRERARRIASARLSRRSHASRPERTMAAHRSAGGYAR